MNKKDIFMVVGVAILGVMASAVIVNMVLGDVNEKSETFNSIEVVKAAVGTPDSEVFNPDAINPTVDVYVGNCIDKNGNGQLDDDELIGCSKNNSDEENTEEENGGE